MPLAPEGPSGLSTSGSLTGFASGPGLAELAHLRFPERWSSLPNPYDLIRRANQGEAEALAVVGESARYLARGLLWMMYTLDPELVIFGHPGDLLGETLLTPLREAVLRLGGGNAQQLPRLAVSGLGAKLDAVAAISAAVAAFRTQRAA
jgi:predicted NBD/HSP70 family sugar kinase